MLNKIEGARLGLFVFLGTALIFVAIFLVGNKSSLFTETVSLKTYFANVEGLRTGASVRLSGMDVGTVSKIALVKDSTNNNVEVSFEVRNDIINFIRLDSEASIETEGLVGAKIVALTAGTDKFEIVKSGDILRSKNPVNMAKIIEETQGIIKYTKNITKDFSEVIAKINNGEGTIGLLINNTDLYNSTVRLTESADTSLIIITNRLKELSDFAVGLGTGMDNILLQLDSSIVDIRKVVAKINNGEGTLGALITDRTPIDSIQTVISNLVKTTESTKQAAESFVENMEALKHNWLFKSYFEQRGYWNKSEYENEIDTKLKELKKQNELLDSKIKKLKELGEKVNK